VVRGGTEVGRLSLVADRVTGVELASGEALPADLVVSCGGRFTESLLRPLGLRVPMIAPTPASPAVGLVVRTAPLGSRLRSVFHVGGLTVRPESGGRLVVHSAAHDERAPIDAAPPDALCAELLALLRSHVRGVERARVEQACVCFRSLPADRLPVAGRLLDGLYVIATHSGVTVAPALADLATAEIMDGADAPILAPYRPQRFEHRTA